jgi:hypothetical protein
MLQFPNEVWMGNRGSSFAVLVFCPLFGCQFPAFNRNLELMGIKAAEGIVAGHLKESSGSVCVSWA